MRKSGILMPIFSLPNEYGIGTLGKCARDFVDFLCSAGQSLWQILPIGHTGFGDSPYQTFSCFAGNPYFIDLDTLYQSGLLTKTDLEAQKTPQSDKIDYGYLYSTRYKVLKKAFSNFNKNDDYYRFLSEQSDWLDSYCVFMTLKELHGSATLQEMADFASGSARIKTENSEIVDFYRFLQYEFFREWKILRQYANKNNVSIIGDIPIYAALDSADVFEYPELFSVDASYKPLFVAGCPPDSFSSAGQLWGNPVYNWEKMRQDNYSWFIRRIKFNLELFDYLRIDHFRGFQSFFSIPANAPLAVAGEWQKGPSRAFFDELKNSLGDNLPIIAEDLGFLSEDVRNLLAYTGFAGMKVLQFAFDSREESDYLPHNYIKNCVVYTGTHDNDTVLGWAQSAAKEDIEKAKNYTRAKSYSDLPAALMDLALGSVADTAILCMQDILGLGKAARINTPGTLGENWRWRMKAGAATPEIALKLYEKTKLFGRLP